MLWYYYWHRLAGCALAWFFWDVSFYGNKLFQSTFIKIISPGASILLTLEWTLLNSFVSLVSLWNHQGTLCLACQGDARDKGCIVMTLLVKQWHRHWKSKVQSIRSCCDVLCRLVTTSAPSRSTSTGWDASACSQWVSAWCSSCSCAALLPMTSSSSMLYTGSRSAFPPPNAAALGFFYPCMLCQHCTCVNPARF